MSFKKSKTIVLKQLITTLVAKDLVVYVIQKK